MGSEKRYDSPFDRKGRIIGVTTTVAIHLLLLFLGFTATLSRIDPLPQEEGILIDFAPLEEEKPILTETGREPRSMNADPDNDITLTQRSEAPVEGIAENKGNEADLPDEGEAEAPSPPEKKTIDRRALFSSDRHRTDTLAVQVAERPTDEIKAGQAQGNTESGNTINTPSARLEGRTLKGDLPLPAYTVEKAGVVVVEILVDQYGKVTSAKPGARGTTVVDKELWKAAKEAALKAVFNQSSSAPVQQIGTISYIFTLR